MEITLLNCDIEGDFIQVKKNNKVQYAKRLYLKNAYYIDRFEEIETYSDDIIDKTIQNIDAGYIDIFYNENINILTLNSLYGIIRPDENLGLWRLTSFALDIAGILNDLHKNGLPQSLIYPLRIGALKKKFTIFPTISGFLPTYEEISRLSPHDWLFFIAPELIRTRAFDYTMLKKADIYSFGRTLQFLSCCISELNSITDILPEINRLVEGKSDILNCQPTEFCREIQPLISRMTSRNPEDRPSLDEIISELSLLNKDNDPGEKINTLLKEKDFDKLTTIIKELNYQFPYGLFDFYKAEKYLLFKTIELARIPPDYTKAISYLTKYLDINPDDIDILLEIAEIYKENRSHSTHIENSIYYFEKAGKLSNWRHDTVKGLTEVLKDYPKPEKKLEITFSIPLSKRIPELSQIRIDANIQLKKFREAWYELTAFIGKSEAGEKERVLAREIADNLSYDELLLWLRNKKYTTDKNLTFLVQIAFDKISNLKNIN